MNLENGKLQEKQLTLINLTKEFYSLFNLDVEYGPKERIKQNLIFYNNNKQQIQDIIKENKNNFIIGACHELGLNIEKNFNTALKYYSQDQENIDCQLRLAVYYSGLDELLEEENKVKVNTKLAFEIATKYANLNNVYAQLLLSNLYLHVNEDKETCLKYIKLAADQNYSQAQFALSNLLKDTEPELSLVYLKRAVENNNSMAYVYLGEYYHDKKDYENATKYYLVAAERKIDIALHNLGADYLNTFFDDNNLINNAKLGLKYFEEASDQDFHISTFDLAVYYWKSDLIKYNLIKQDLDKSIDYFTRVSKIKPTNKLNKDLINNSNYYLGRIYLDKDKELALIYFTKGAENNHVQCLFELGDLYATGINNNELINDEKAFGFYKQAADLGDSFSMYIVGLSYKNNIGVEKNDILCFNYLKMATDNGHIDACGELADCYKNSIGVEYNLKLSKYYEYKYGGDELTLDDLNEDGEYIDKA